MHFFLFLFISFFLFLNSLNAHSGRTNSKGCHNQTSNNSYHCHKKKYNHESSSSKQNLIVIDGDTISINNVLIRFSGIDAPESYYRGRTQKCKKANKTINCGRLSKEHLMKIIGKKKVECIVEKKPDFYNRKLGECFINNKSLSRIMVKDGYAFDYPKYSQKKFAKDQKYAKMKKLGLWSMKFDYPWIFRENIRKK